MKKNENIFDLLTRKKKWNYNHIYYMAVSQEDLRSARLKKVGLAPQIPQVSFDGNFTPGNSQTLEQIRSSSNGDFRKGLEKVYGKEQHALFVFTDDMRNDFISAIGGEPKDHLHQTLADSLFLLLPETAVAYGLSSESNVPIYSRLKVKFHEKLKPEDLKVYTKSTISDINRAKNGAIKNVGFVTETIISQDGRDLSAFNDSFYLFASPDRKLEEEDVAGIEIPIKDETKNLQPQEVVYIDDETQGLSKQWTQEDIDMIAALSGDFNPAHTKKDYLKNTFLSKIVPRLAEDATIAHGVAVLAASVLSTTEALQNDGKIKIQTEDTTIADILMQDIYKLSGLDVEFKFPVIVDETTTTPSVREIESSDPNNKIFELVVKNQDGKPVITGAITFGKISKGL